MELVITTRRPGESDDEHWLRNRWALRGITRDRDLRASDALRGVTSRRTNSNDDVSVLQASGWPHSIYDEAKLMDPWRPRPAVDPALPPWSQGFEPPPVRPVTIASDRAQERQGEWLGLVEARVMIPPDIRQVPIWALPQPAQPLLDLAAAPTNFDVASYFDQSLERNLAGWVTPDVTTTIRRTLPMQASNVHKHVVRGAALIWKNGKYVVQMGKRVLGVVGAVGAVKDAYDFFRYVNSLPTARPLAPKVEYQFSSNTFVFRWPDGRVTATPEHWKLK